MQVAATYESDAIKFAQPMQFVHQKFQVIVNIPEAELAPAAQPPSSLDELPELTPKQLSRIEAFAMREDR